jgi:hypothetical protein
MQYLKTLACVFLASIAMGCGGGGGSAGTSSAGTGGTTGTGGGVTSTVPSMVVAIYNASKTQVYSVNMGGAFVVRATLTDASGAAIANKAVTFSVNSSSLASLGQASNLTDSTGSVEVSLSPASVSAVGAVTVLASATVGSTAVSGQTDVAVAATSLTLGSLALGSKNLASAGNASVSVVASIGGAVATTVPVNVTFAASCGSFNGASSVGVTTDGTGTASTVYSAVRLDGSLCSGAVVISATSSGTAAQTANLTVAAPTASAVTFVNATPAQIYVAGAGNAEQSIVKFKVTSSTGSALANVGVTFSLQQNPSGVGLAQAGSTANSSTTTDSGGFASVSVFSGTIPGPIKVRAALTADATIFSETQNLTVASGPPSQRYMSLAVSTFNIEGWSYDGVSTTLTARLADRQGNAVADGTVVNFTAEGGQVASSCATARINGISQCSVLFQSQNPRPTNGRVAVLAWAEGTKDYSDVNANNRYDSGTDVLLNMGDAYRDDNEDGIWNAGEFIVPHGGSGPCATAGGPFPSAANTCDSQLAASVRQQAVVLFSSSEPFISNVSATSASISFDLASNANRLLPMPAGTTVSGLPADSTCTVGSVVGSTVVNVSPGTDPNASLVTSHTINLKSCSAGMTVYIVVVTPLGLSTSIPVRLQ